MLRRSSRASSLLVLIACLLIGIRSVAGFVCYTCFTDLERPLSRSFHLHAGGDANPCHHGRVDASPLKQWACTVTQDDPGYVLPEIPRLPVVGSLSLPLILLLVYYRRRFPIPAIGRGPPVLAS